MHPTGAGCWTARTPRGTRPAASSAKAPTADGLQLSPASPRSSRRADLRIRSASRRKYHFALSLYIQRYGIVFMVDGTEAEPVSGRDSMRYVTWPSLAV